MKRLNSALGALLVLALTACSGSGTSPQTPTQSNPAANVFQFAVGTANIFGDLSPLGNFKGLNVAVTYRQPANGLHPGDSGTAVNSPTLTLPAALGGPAGSGGADGTNTIESGPAPAELGTSAMTSTAQTSSNLTTFGTSGGAFGLGIEPFNFTGGGVPFTYTPYVQPMYDSVSGGGNSFTPWGGPPAFPNIAGGGGPTNATAEGLDVFLGVGPTAGAYTLSISIPANTGTIVQTANATLNSTKLLPAISPAIPSLDGKGGGSFKVTLPAGVTEAYVQIQDLGPGAGSTSCNGGGGFYLTLETTASGSVPLPDNDGPGGAPSICTMAQNGGGAGAGDVFTVQTIGFDYPWFEASYPNSNLNPSPAIVGGAGQDDITISSQAGYQSLAMGHPKVVKGDLRRFNRGRIR